jgi:hypothetical protein
MYSISMRGESVLEDVIAFAMISIVRRGGGLAISEHSDIKTVGILEHNVKKLQLLFMPLLTQV